MLFNQQDEIMINQTIKLGDMVLVKNWNDTYSWETVTLIEICKPGEKDGQPVDECNPSKHSNGVMEGYDRWFYFNQIVTVVRH